jgi:hypothetical protein
MQLIEVKDRSQAKDFIRINIEINKNDPNYIRPLDKDLNEVFDPEKNKAFRFGEVIRWILKDAEGKLIGRIAAFVNKNIRTKVMMCRLAVLVSLIVSMTRMLLICYLM